jgi:uracil-DNA glycosylase family 4
MGFFDAAEEKVTATVTVGKTPRCGACGLFRSCKRPKLPYWGDGGRGILVVGPYMSKEDAKAGRLLSGTLGRRLSQELSAVGLDLEDDCWVTASTICSRKDGKPPSPEQVAACRPNVINLIEELRPKAVLLVGSQALYSTIPVDWKADAKPLTELWAGEAIPSQRWNTWLIPAYDPQLFDEERREDMFVYSFRASLALLAAVERHPWQTMPDYAGRCETLFNAAEAAAAIETFCDSEVVAFDYETNCLKPEQTHSKIWSVAWSDGRRTVAAPWYPEVRAASQKVICSPNAKVATNLKFETRWTLQEFGHGVRNWVWDTMQAAHWMSQRPGITSLKFQSYAMLGQGDYDSHLKEHLGSSSAYATAQNNINKIPIASLLQYNAMDALLEIVLTMEQIDRAGHPLEFRDMLADLRPRPLEINWSGNV